MSERRCGDCEFFEQDTDNGGGCHRQPIAAVWNPHEATPESWWPWVAISDWCGEFRPREPAVKESLTTARFEVGQRVKVGKGDANVGRIKEVIPTYRVEFEDGIGGGKTWRAGELCPAAEGEEKP